tara:strand:+ start:3027 stop:3854 length:828 start_codon:yes stop_codon:yes gene_type:complete
MKKDPPKAPKPKDRTNEMSFLEHLEELRWRIIKGIAGVFLGVIVAFIFSDFFVNEVLLGPAKSTFFMYDIIRIDAIDLTLQSRKLPGQFFTFWGVLFIVGFIIGSPILFYQLWSFVEPAFEKSTKIKTFVSTFFITVFFLMGVSFGYLILVPFALQFFTQFQISEVIRNDFDINAYFSSLTTWVISCGMIFQIPILSYSLSKIGILTPELLKKFRRHAVIASLILAAFLTPPDPISQILIGIPLVVLYEFSIVISRFAVKQRKRDLEKTFAENES